jgi:hypothetical protein
MTGAEELDKVGHFCDEKLQKEAKDKGYKHQGIGPLSHSKDGSFHVTHTQCVKKLGDPEDGKGVSLTACQEAAV